MSLAQRVASDDKWDSFLVPRALLRTTEKPSLLKLFSSCSAERAFLTSKPALQSESAEVELLSSCR